jgi:hypothetical protein
MWGAFGTSYVGGLALCNLYLGMPGVEGEGSENAASALILWPFSGPQMSRNPIADCCAWLAQACQTLTAATAWMKRSSLQLHSLEEFSRSRR